MWWWMSNSHVPAKNALCSATDANADVPTTTAMSTSVRALAKHVWSSLCLRFCPPPPICPPPPPPPMPCPPPPPPMPRPSCPCMGMQRPSFYPQYAPQYYQPMLSMPQPMPVPAAGGCGGGAVVPAVRIPAQVSTLSTFSITDCFRTIVAVGVLLRANTKVSAVLHLQPKQSTHLATVQNWKILSLTYVISVLTVSTYYFRTFPTTPVNPREWFRKMQRNLWDMMWTSFAERENSATLHTRTLSVKHLKTMWLVMLSSHSSLFFAFIVSLFVFTATHFLTFRFVSIQHFLRIL